MTETYILYAVLPLLAEFVAGVVLIELLLSTGDIQGGGNL